MAIGIACRLLFDLGLHEDCSNLVRQERLTASDANIRHNLFLATFVYDKLWSLYLGRPSSISEAYLTAARRSNKDVVVTDAMNAWVSLCLQISQVTDVLNCPAMLARDARARIAELDVRVQSCYQSLPRELTYQEPRLSDLDMSAYGLNIQFCGIRIVLHRMSTHSRTEKHDNVGSQTASSLDPDLARSSSIIHENGVQIARLTRAYRQIFGVEKVSTIMLDNMYVAARALISHILWLQSLSTDLDQQWLRSLADTMKEVEVHFPVTARMRSTLSRLVENTILAGMFGPQVNQAIGQPSVPTLGPQTLAAGPWGTAGLFLNDWTYPGTDADMEGVFGVGDDRWMSNTESGALHWNIGVTA